MIPQSPGNVYACGQKKTKKTSIYYYHADELIVFSHFQKFVPKFKVLTFQNFLLPFHFSKFFICLFHLVGFIGNTISDKLPQLLPRGFLIYS